MLMCSESFIRMYSILTIVLEAMVWTYEALSNIVRILICGDVTNKLSADYIRNTALSLDVYADAKHLQAI
jgi:hypothetical protein